MKFTDPTNVAGRRWTRTQIGLLWGLASGVLVPWAAFSSVELSFRLGSEVHSIFVTLWNILAMPGFLMSELFNVNVYRPYGQDFTFAGVFILTITNAALGSLIGALVGCIRGRS